MDGLRKYQAKRKFTNTKEPEGKISKKGENTKQIFVVQKHWATHLHYDFRLEFEGVLKSWAVPKGIPNPGEKRLAMMVEDHPYDYKDFEGIIPKGNYGAGAVMIWDAGEYKLGGEINNLQKRIEKGDFSFMLNGKKLKGEFSLVKIKKSEKNEWLLICKNREAVKSIDQDISVKSGLSKEQIENGKLSLKDIDGAQKRKMPSFIKPMLSSLVEDPFDNSKWLFEIKWDGYRVLAVKNADVINLYSRNKKNFNQQFLEIYQAISKLRGDFILDGEVIAIDDKGNSNFQLLQNYLNNKEGTLLYYVFDIIFLNDYDLSKVKLLDRKKILQKIIEEAVLKNIRISEFVLEKGTQLFKLVADHGGEGIIGKRIDSIYQENVRSKEWVKIRSMLTQEVVIGGFTQPRGGRKKFGALVVGIFEKGKLQYAGHVGGGFSDKILSLAAEKMFPLVTEKSPFENPSKTNMPVTWIKPELVCNVRFTEWTKDGSMRHPIFLGMRLDKDPQDVVREKIIETETIKSQGNNNLKVKKDIGDEVDGQDLIFSNLEKIYWTDEGYTKGNLIAYYRKISKYILPYLKNRPQSLNRFPNGIKEKNFFQKDISNVPSWAKTVKIFSESENKYINYLICNGPKTLLYMANLGCIEINVWNSSLGNLENPDYMVFDIDPVDRPFFQTVIVAKEFKKILDAVSIKAFCKTSGSRGLHIFVPLEPKYSYKQVKEFARLVCIIVNSRLLKITSLERSPEKRKNKIYLDYLQNRMGQTMAAPYCIRPKEGAPVSTPLEWRELNEKLNSKRFNIKTIFKRLEKKGDVWKGFFDVSSDNDLAKSILELERLLIDKKRNKSK